MSEITGLPLPVLSFVVGAICAANGHGRLPVGSQHTEEGAVWEYWWDAGNSEAIVIRAVRTESKSALDDAITEQFALVRKLQDVADWRPDQRSFEEIARIIEDPESHEKVAQEMSLKYEGLQQMVGQQVAEARLRAYQMRMASLKLDKEREKLRALMARVAGIEAPQTLRYPANVYGKGLWTLVPGDKPLVVLGPRSEAIEAAVAKDVLIPGFFAFELALSPDRKQVLYVRDAGDDVEVCDAYGFEKGEWREVPDGELILPLTKTRCAAIGIVFNDDESVLLPAADKLRWDELGARRDYSKLTVKDLRITLGEAGIEAPPKATKAELIALCDAMKAEASVGNEEEPEGDGADAPEDDL